MLKKQLFSLFFLFGSLCILTPVSAKENAAIKKMLENRYTSESEYSTPTVEYNDEIDCYEIRRSSFDNGFIIYKALADAQGNEIIPLGKYDIIYTFYLKEHPFCLVGLNNNKGLFHVGKKKEILPPIYDDINFNNFNKEPIPGYNNNHPLFFVRNHGKKGLFSLDEMDFIIPLEYDNVQYKSNYIYYVTKDGKQSVFDLTKKKELMPFIYTSISYDPDSPDIINVKKDGKTGLYSIRDQKELLAPKYDEISRSYHTKNFLNIENNGKTGLIDTNYNEVVPPLYDYLIPNDSVVIVVKDAVYEDFKFKKNGKWGAYNIKTGKLIIEPKYDFIHHFVWEGIIRCAMGVNPESAYPQKLPEGTWGAVDMDGNTVIDFIYESISYFDKGVAQVKKDGVVTLLQNPLTSTSLAFGGSGVKQTAIDTEIPSTNTSREETFVFIIANEDYKDWNSDYAIHDGDTFKKYCEKRLGVPEKNIRYMKDATYGTLQGMLTRCEDIADVYDGDASFIIYFAGIGYNDASSDEYYLLPVDVSLSNVKATGLGVKDMFTKLGKVPARELILLTDAPFQGVDRSGTPLAEHRGVAMKAKSVEVLDNAAWLSAPVDSSEKSIDSDSTHGVFTLHLLKTLKDNPKITLGNLGNELSSRIRKSSVAKEGNVAKPQIVISESISQNNL